jgi:cytoskeleton protein RodZ
MMADEFTMNTPESEIIGFAPLGEVFATARNAKKLGLKDVSNSLRLSIKQIEALEKDDFASLPQAMITRGFIRNYARLLEVDAEPLLASYRARMPEALPSALNVQTAVNQIMTTKNNKSSMKYIVASVFILVSFIAWYVLTNYLPKHKTSAPAGVVETTSNVVTTANVPLPEVALPAAERVPEAGSNPDTTATNAVVGTAESANVATNLQAVDAAQVINNNSDKITVEAAEHSTPTSKVPVENNTLAANATGLAQQPLSTQADSPKSGLKTNNSNASSKSVNIAVSEQTWVRVTDKAGAVVFEKMLNANSEDGFDGLPPFKLLIGNAKATRLTFLGQPVDLAASTKNNVAHITLE